MENLNTRNKKNQNYICNIEPGSIASELGIEIGEILVSINGQNVEDVFDYRFLIQDEYLEIEMQNKEGEIYIAEIEKEMEEDIGIEFESGLMDEAKSCRNKCIFCFIDQLPPNMRKTLYFKDDDSRLSFLQGNYVTLTNMSEHDISRIVYYHLSPINISVHTTDLELRKKMLKNKNADKVLNIMSRFAEAGIEMNLQVVLCKGVNDGEKLKQTMEDCVKFYPQAKSMSVVPIGLTKYRENLYPMEPFEVQDAIEVLKIIETFQKKYKTSLGSAFVFASDEFYLRAKKPLPPAEAYEDFSQYENGVGMLSLLNKEFMDYYFSLEGGRKNITLSIATGKAAFWLISSFADKLMEKFSGLKINTYCITNLFFGEEITVSGLLTGQDIIKQLKEEDLGQFLVLPESLLRNGTKTLLDDIEINQIETSLDIPIKITKNSGRDFIDTIINTEEQQ